VDRKTARRYVQAAVPGGKWQTVISSPAWAAKAASSLFHARVR
jgi:hypothetical protein